MSVIITIELYYIHKEARDLRFKLLVLFTYASEILCSILLLKERLEQDLRAHSCHLPYFMNVHSSLLQLDGLTNNRARLQNHRPSLFGVAFGDSCRCGERRRLTIKVFRDVRMEEWETGKKEGDEDKRGRGWVWHPPHSRRQKSAALKLFFRFSFKGSRVLFPCKFTK